MLMYLVLKVCPILRTMLTPMYKRMLLSLTFSIFPQSMPKWHDIFDLYFAGTCN